MVKTSEEIVKRILGDKKSKNLRAPKNKLVYSPQTKKWVSYPRGPYHRTNEEEEDND